MVGVWMDDGNGKIIYVSENEVCAGFVVVVAVCCVSEWRRERTSRIMHAAQPEAAFSF
jgi:hypothetical protein